MNNLLTEWRKYLKEEEEVEQEAPEAEEQKPEEPEEEEKSDFEVHTMYNPETGESNEAQSEEEHNELAAKGFVHVNPEEIRKAIEDEGGAAGLDAVADEVDAEDEELQKAMMGMPDVGQHKDGDYILGDDDEIKIDEEFVSSLVREIIDEANLEERCQKGYKTHPTQKTKEMYGKTYRNCVKAEGLEEGNAISYSDVRQEYDAILNFLKKDILQKQGGKYVADALELLANEVRDGLHSPDPFDKENWAYFDKESGTQPNLKKEAPEVKDKFDDEVEKRNKKSMKQGLAHLKKEGRLDSFVDSIIDEMLSEDEIDEAAKCTGPTKKASSDSKGKKWMKCVKSDSGGYKRIHWGQKGVRVTGKSGDTKRKKSFKARHNCSKAKSNTPQGQACKDWAE